MYAVKYKQNEVKKFYYAIKPQRNPSNNINLANNIREKQSSDITSTSTFQKLMQNSQECVPKKTRYIYFVILKISHF